MHICTLSLHSICLIYVFLPLLHSPLFYFFYLLPLFLSSFLIRSPSFLSSFFLSPVFFLSYFLSLFSSSFYLLNLLPPFLSLHQVESLGGSFLSVPYVEDGSGAGGYAKEMSAGYKEAEVRTCIYRHTLCTSSSACFFLSSHASCFLFISSSYFSFSFLPFFFSFLLSSHSSHS